MKRRAFLVLAAVLAALCGRAWASEEEFLQWQEVRVVMTGGADVKQVVLTAKTNGEQYQRFAVEVFDKRFELTAGQLGALKGFPLSSLRTTHESGYAELGGHTVHLKLERVFAKDGNVGRERVRVSVSKGKGLEVAGPEAVTATAPIPDPAPAAPAAPAAGKMDRQKVLRLAEAFAKKQGLDLARYAPPRVSFAVARKKWEVHYEGTDLNVDGNHFWITVDDQTGALDVEPGE